MALRGMHIHVSHAAEENGRAWGNRLQVLPIAAGLCGGLLDPSHRMQR